MASDERPTATTVVIATRNRRDELVTTLDRLTSLPERPDVVVVDNASRDGTVRRVVEQFAAVGVIALPANLGAAARTVGARCAATPLVAFSDDDSWWEPGALAAAAARFDADPALGLLAGRVLVGTHGTLDPVSAAMAAGALDPWLRPAPDGPRGITGFLACAAIVRRCAFLATGGFEAHLLIGGEEELVALDLADAGWKLVYAPEVVARHHPSTSRDVATRRRLLARNHLLTAWLRYPPVLALSRSTRGGFGVGATARAGAAAAGSLSWVAARRHRVRPDVAHAFTTSPQDT